MDGSLEPLVTGLARLGSLTNMAGQEDDDCFCEVILQTLQNDAQSTPYSCLYAWRGVVSGKEIARKYDRINVPRNLVQPAASSELPPIYQVLT